VSVEESMLFTGAAVCRAVPQVFFSGAQVHQHAGGEQLIQFSGLPAIAHFCEAAAQLYHCEHVLDPRSRFALDSVVILHCRVALQPGAPATVRSVLGFGRGHG
jgi:hypothetical protein